MTDSKDNTPKYSCEKFEDNKSLLWHAEGDTKTLIAITDNLEKAHFLAAAANQFDYDKHESQLKTNTPIEAIEFGEFLIEATNGDMSVWVDKNPHGIRSGYYTLKQLYQIFKTKTT